MNTGRLCVSVLVIVGLTTLVLLLPLPTAARGLALIQVDPEHAQRVVVPDVGGFLEKMVVRDGQRVAAGDVLAIMSNPRLTIALRVNESDQGLRETQRAALVAQLAEPASHAQEHDGSLQTNRMEMQALLAEHASLKEQLNRLILRAPREGVVMGLQPHDQTGRWLEKGTELCHIGDERALRAVLLLEPGDQKLIATGSLATIHVHGSGTMSWPGVVTEIAQVEASKVPAALSHRTGGDVATQQDPVSRHEKPNRQHYMVAVHFEQKDQTIHPGVMARVKIHVGPQTLGGRLQRFLATTFNWGW
jgi:putative peptide zinc metalloprotease protein